MGMIAAPDAFTAAKTLLCFLSITGLAMKFAKHQVKDSVYLYREQRLQLLLTHHSTHSALRNFF